MKIWIKPKSELDSQHAIWDLVYTRVAMTRLKVILLSIVVMLFSAPAVAQQLPVKIGFVAELSGPGGALGQDMYDAFMLVVERKGGKLGGVAVQILREDSQLKPEVANQIIDKLIEKDRVSIVTGFTFSNVMMAVYKKIVDNEIFLIGSNASPSQLAGAQCSPFYFQIAAQNDQRAEAMGRYAADKGFKKVYAMAPNYQAGKDFIAGFKREYKRPLLEEVYTSLNQLDFQAELAQLAAASPDAVYVFYPGGLGVQFVRQWRQSGLADKIPLLSTSTVDGINLPALKEAALGVTHASLWGPDFDNAESKRFVADFDKRYGRLPSEYAATAYDSALLLDAALAKVNGNVADKKAFMAALKSAEFPSLRGKFKFNHNQLGIQDFYIFDVVKDASGRYSHRTVVRAMADAQDAYHTQCPMK
jgi:branched-chain amino acid transport system substrate-binding protein